MMKKKLIFVMILFLIQSCKENVIPPDDPGEINTLYKLTGKICEVKNEVKTYLEGVKVKLNADSSYTNSEGEFVFNNLIAGTYDIEIQKEGYGKETKSIKIEGSVTDIEVEYTLSIRYKLNGKIYEDKNGVKTYLEGVMVKLITASTYTNIQGEFVFNNLTEGLYVIQIEKEGYKKETKSVDIEGPATIIEVEFALLPLVDYLPLYVGKKWKYIRKQVNSSMSTVNQYGLAIWEIISKENTSGGTKYNLREVWDDSIHRVDIDSYGQLIKDTTWTEIVITNFSFLELNNQVVEISSPPPTFKFLVNRYDIMQDSVRVSPIGDPIFWSYLIVKPAKGISYMRMGGGHSSFFWYNMYTQIEESQ
jgi:hypothetical protein